MHWLDWFIISIPLLIVLYVCAKSQKYVKGVSDFLAAGRVAGRYVIAVAGGEAALGLISVIAMVEVYMASGFGYSFWSKLTVPLGLFFGLTGFCTYRFRETRALTICQFFEMRYSRSFRISAACIQFLSGLVNYAIFPAVGARFLVYFLDLPIHISIFGWNFPTYGLMLILCIGVAASIACLGGQITIMVSDCVQGIISYPLYMLLVFYLFYRFSWHDDMLPTIISREPGMSFINPYDINKLRNFNLFYVFAGIFSSFFSRLSWAGCQGYMASARSAHEEKMGGLLGTWRSGFSGMMTILIALVVYVFLMNPKYQPDVKDAAGNIVSIGVNKVNKILALKTLDDVAKDQPQEVRDRITEKINAAKPRFDSAEQVELDNESTDHNSVRTQDNYKRIAVEELKKVNPKVAQTYGSIHTQMTATLTMREILPMGFTGIFAALMIFLMISTDNTYMHSWGSILVQDIILPLRGDKRPPLTPERQLKLLRGGILFVALFAFVFSLCFAQVDYIIMFFAITGAIWCGGGIVITMGLYWRRGTAAGAFTGVLVGAVVGVGGMLMQMNWVAHIYPWLVAHNWADSLNTVLVTLSKPFNPYIVWTVTPDKFPINSTEMSFIGHLSAVLGYIVVSLLTCKQPFNLEKMLHRGKYSQDGSGIPMEKINIKKFFKGLIGITKEYTFGDKILAWSVFLYTLIYGFVLCFIVPIIWNIFYKWPAEWWGTYFYITTICVTCVIGVISTFWFAIGGTRDLRQLFIDLKNKTFDITDNGTVTHTKD